MKRQYLILLSLGFSLPACTGSPKSSSVEPTPEITSPVEKSWREGLTSEEISKVEPNLAASLDASKGADQALYLNTLLRREYEPEDLSEEENALIQENQSSLEKLLKTSKEPYDYLAEGLHHVVADSDGVRSFARNPLVTHVSPAQAKSPPRRGDEVLPEGVEKKVSQAFAAWLTGEMTLAEASCSEVGWPGSDDGKPAIWANFVRTPRGKELTELAEFGGIVDPEDPYFQGSARLTRE